MNYTKITLEAKENLKNCTHCGKPMERIQPPDQPWINCWYCWDCKIRDDIQLIPFRYWGIE